LRVEGLGFRVESLGLTVEGICTIRPGEIVVAAFFGRITVGLARFCHVGALLYLLTCALVGSVLCMMM
jgi:hypothetical protein